ncbi:topology modulation protein [Peribacillus muralis]|uniref:Topology modulation protein n=1 Tax=Peribacillus muralis TaxID=264697 RepID=A0A1B3XJX1_9BACI|nr:topology modulation protein [Peribacillus muralis]AOH53509.1 topology modulation protein [Peribacillus muralis]
MNRIMVIGVSSGVGKSTFARLLGERLDIDVHHLDTFYWRPDWVEAPLEDFLADQEEVLALDQWILEGNYSNSIDLRLKQATTIFYLELPLHVCLYRVVKRRLVYRGKTRPDIGEGCEEKLDWPFLKFIITTYYSRKENMKKRLAEIRRNEPEKVIIILDSRKKISAYFPNRKG